MKTFLLIAFWGVILAIVTWWTFSGFDGSAMDIHGWVAMGLGIGLSLIVGVGLMGLVFYSARKGYDDRIPVDTEPHDED
ncbi:MAG: hypothetical protein ABUL55_02740 [Pseudomonadota bacterium]